MPGEPRASSSSDTSTPFQRIMGAVQATMSFTGFGRRRSEPVAPLAPAPVVQKPLDPDAQQRARHAEEMLATHSVKVRDFAYESTLPPVPSYRRVQREESNSRQLKRRRYTYEEDGVELLYTVQPTPASQQHDLEDTRAFKRARPLERENTEIVLESHSLPPSQNPDFGDISDLLQRMRDRVPVHFFHRLSPSDDDREVTPLIEFEMDNAWPSQSDTAEDPDVAMEWVPTPVITPQPSEVLSTHSSFCSSLTSLSSLSSQSSEAFVPARLSLEPSASNIIGRSRASSSLARCIDTPAASSSSSPSSTPSGLLRLLSSPSTSCANSRHSSPRKSTPQISPHKLRSGAVTAPSTPRKGKDLDQRKLAEKGKTRSTLSRHLSERNVSLQPVLRRSPRMKKAATAAVVASSTRQLRSRA